MKTSNLIFLLLISGILALFFESTLIAFPFIFFIGALLVYHKKLHLVIVALIFAFLIDTLRVVNFGFTPLFLLAIIFLTYLYEKYSGSKDSMIVLIIIAAVGFIYANVMYYSITLLLSFYAITLISLFSIGYLKKRRILVW